MSLSESPTSSLTPEKLESPSTSPTNEDHVCAFCSNKLKEPRLLSCLHVFCTPCLEKLLTGQEPSGSDEEVDTERPLVAGDAIVCPTCKQKTPVTSRDVNDLALDFVMCNMLDMSAIEDMQIVCTSCKAKERAVARCSDCANFLCPNCVTAHQYMRCFENHKVVSFEDLQAGGEALSIHKPLFCTVHPSESMKYFCLSCQVPICNECMVTDHKGHQCDRVSDMDTKQVEELQSLVTECKGKIKVCEDASTSLENTLSDLQLERDNAKGLIEETFHSYKTILEKRQDTLLKKLEELHTKQELNVMELFHDIEKTIEKIEDGCKVTERVLNSGNTIEILSLKKTLVSQLQFLINNTPKPDIDVSIEFLTDAQQFETAIENTYGHFASDEAKPLQEPPPPLSLHNSLEVESFNLPPAVLSPESPLMPPTVNDFLLNQPLQPLPTLVTAMPPSSGIGGASTSMSGIMPERSMSRGSQSPAMSDSGISVDASSSGSGTNTPMANLATLMKLGAVSINSQGQITLNGQPLAGLNVNNVTGLTPSLLSQAQSMGHVMRPPSSQPDTNINLNLSSGSNSRSQTPSIDVFCAGNQSPTSSSSGFSMASGAGGGQFSHHPPLPVRGSSKMTPMQIRCKFGQLGPGKGQFNSPHGFCLGMEEDIIVADTNNHRIQVFEKTGEFKYQFGIPGREEGQLWHPRKVAVMRSSGKYVVCDRGNERSRMQIFTKNGHFIRKIAIRYIDIVAGLAITQHGHIVAVDSVSPTVFCIAESGDLLKWFDCSEYMREPSDIAVSGKDFFVCDFKGHCVVVFDEEGHFLRRIGCENITNFPNGIDISDAGDVLVGDSHGNRFHVAVFQHDGSLIGEFECPYVKVSRCCGLKITAEGYVVTLAKNNHHVLVLNTLYIA